ncbi:hypothetical protein BC827DRAFT_1302154 [Russula dissimulans]|nr:hypothetical protein BC827DRAFT_1302154 [Russula dissimulans]
MASDTRRCMRLRKTSRRGWNKKCFGALTLCLARAIVGEDGFGFVGSVEDGVAGGRRRMFKYALHNLSFGVFPAARQGTSRRATRCSTTSTGSQSSRACDASNLLGSGWDVIASSVGFVEEACGRIFRLPSSCYFRVPFLILLKQHTELRESMQYSPMEFLEGSIFIDMAMPGATRKRSGATDALSMPLKEVGLVLRICVTGHFMDRGEPIT